MQPFIVFIIFRSLYQSLGCKHRNFCYLVYRLYGGVLHLNNNGEMLLRRLLFRVTSVIFVCAEIIAVIGLSFAFINLSG